MIVALLVLGPLLVVALVSYIRFRPTVEPARRRALMRFNAAVILIVLGLCFGSAWYMWASMVGGMDEAWWPILAFLMSLCLASVALFLAVLVRSLLFPPPKQ